MQVMDSIEAIKRWRKKLYCQEREPVIALVPTMGFLHAGHLSLVKQARKTADITVVSIFVNPVQFDDPEDLNSYPRDLKRDLSLLEAENTDIVWTPSVADIIGAQKPEIFLDYPGLTNKLCGAHRPGHFSGVLWIVHNLFQWIQPHKAYFGLKDYQQYLLIRKMASDFRFPIEILPGEIVRDSDGLALSSRNARLTPGGRFQALNISKALFSARTIFEGNPNATVAELDEAITARLGKMKVDYAGCFHPETLEKLSEETTPQQVLLAASVYVEGVRLIDNLLLNR